MSMVDEIDERGRFPVEWEDRVLEYMVKGKDGGTHCCCVLLRAFIFRHIGL